MSARILIVEDEQIVAADLESKVLRIGHEVIGIAASGEEAIRVAEKDRPDLVLMDIRLKGKMDGTEAAGIIHNITGAPVIFITAYAGMFFNDSLRTIPPGVCLSKPFSTHQLKAALESTIPAI